MKQNGNEYLLELLENNEKKLLDFIFKSSFYISKEKMNLYEETNAFIRNGQSNVLYQKVESKYQLIKRTSELKKRLKKFSSEDNLYFKINDNNYVPVKIDSTGNAAPRKFIAEVIGQNLHNRNYKISHLEKKPNTPIKHGFKNIIIIPSFLDHFVDRDIILDKKNVNNVAKLISLNIYNLDEDFFNKFIPTDDEKKYAQKIIKNINLLN